VQTQQKKKAVALISALPGAGHLSAAIINVSMGFLAGLVALGLRGETPDARLVIRALRNLPLGPLLLVMIALGALCLVGWRMLQAFWDIESKGRSFKGLCQRGRFLFGAVFYLTIPICVVRILFGFESRSGEQIAEQAASSIIHFPFGWSIVLGAGMGFLVTGAFYLYRMWRGNFERVFRCDQMTARQRKLCFALGRFGCAARGAIFLVIGYYLMLAGWNLDPHQVEGQAGALQIIARQPLGPVMLGIVSLGLIAFGAYSLAELRYGKDPREKILRLCSGGL
jgi:hypothetical protein